MGTTSCNTHFLSNLQRTNGFHAPSVTRYSNQRQPSEDMRLMSVITKWQYLVLTHQTDQMLHLKMGTRLMMISQCNKLYFNLLFNLTIYLYISYYLCKHLLLQNIMFCLYRSLKDRTSLEDEYTFQRENVRISKKFPQNNMKITQNHRSHFLHNKKIDFSRSKIPLQSTPVRIVPDISCL